ncbi:MAG: rhomboid family intramembrane serine protease [Fibrobacter sp.]|nr:rhomboid family intramembrane serine protease [Fibrobacter sp.]
MVSFGPSGVSRSIRYIIISTIVVYLFEIVPWTRQLSISWGALVPVEAFFHGQIWRFFTYIFLHDPNQFFHILINMLMLWMFGVEIENIWGSRRFFIFYLICGAGSGLFSVFSLFSFTSSMIPVIGASGAVLGVMTMNAYYFPNRQVLLFFILPVNIRLVVLGYAIYSLSGAISSQGIISHITHLGGILVALAYIKLYPYVSGYYTSFTSFISERAARRRLAQKKARNRYFEQNVDPILEKISKFGMESLTKKEKKILRNAARYNKDELKKKRIIPFDPFR